MSWLEKKPPRCIGESLNLRSIPRALSPTVGGCCPSNVATTAMFVAHRLAPTHPRSQSPEAELARATKHPKRRSPAIFILLLNIRNVKTTPHRCLPLVQSHGGVCKVRGGLGPPRAPPTLSPMTVSFSEIRPLGTRFLTNTRRR